MSARGARKSDNRASHEPPRKPPAPEPRPDEDDAIEILEVVGVDETTGAEAERRPDARAPARSQTPRHEPRHHKETGEVASALKDALAEKEKYYDLLLRKQAEFENFRKRTERERDDQRAAATVDLFKHLLPILDNLERALATSEGSNDPLRQGVVLIHQQFLDALRREGIVPMETLGARFDPRLHEAVLVMEVDGFEQGVILEEMQRGYMYEDRLLRPALVKVASGRKPEPGAATQDPAVRRR